jgi:hypothetical protein
VAEELSSASGVTPFGRYLLLRRLNIGGMAEVHLAKAIGLHGVERLVAIKRILPGVAEDPEFVRMFVDEAKLTVQLSHANLAQTLELGRIGKTLYIAMEYVSGIDLRQIWDHAQHGGELPLGVVLYLVSKLCEGLDYAHRKADAEGHGLGIVHRDISPQNVMVAYDGQVKIIDFGIAKAKVRASRTRVGILKGKFAYMSPEQVAGLELDGRSDVFAVGIILYELLTRTRLFKSESDFATLEKVRYVELFPPRLVRPGVPRDLEKIVLKTLHRDREERIQSAEALQQLLMRFAIASGENFTTRDMQAYLAQTFPGDLAKEHERLARLMQIAPPANFPIDDESEPHPGEETFAALPGAFTANLETHIFDTEQAPRDGTQLGSSVRPVRLPEEYTDTPHLRRNLAHEPTRILPVEDSASRSSARLRDHRFGRESVTIWAAAVIAALLVVGAFWASARVNPNARLSIESEPQQAEIVINNRGVPHPLYNYEVEPGDLMVEVRSEGFCPWSRHLQLQARESFATRVTLVPKAAGVACP